MHRRNNCARAKKRANQRAAKERIRLARALAPADLSAEIAAASACVPPPARSALRFRVTIECLTDGAKASFTTALGPHGFTISPTLAGQKTASVIANYRPARTFPLTPRLSSAR